MKKIEKLELENLIDEGLSLKEIAKYLQQELELTEKLKKGNFNEELQEVISNLTKLYEQKGNLEEKKRLWESSLKNLNEAIEELDKIVDDVIHGRM